MIYGKKVKDTVAEKRMEAQAFLWEAMTGLGEVSIARIKHGTIFCTGLL